MSEHAVKGSPRYPGLHVHVGAWLMTLHWALTPQTPGHGSTQWRLTQARLGGQSALMVHSGLQLGGEPIICGKQEH